MFIYMYLSDIVMASTNPTEHINHLCQVLQLLSANGLVVNQAKCIFRVTYLGYLINTKGTSPLPSMVDAVHNFPIPDS